MYNSPIFKQAPQGPPRARRRRAGSPGEAGGDPGFSLVELLIVVAVIGIVAAIAVPNLLVSRRAANEASAVSAVRMLSSAQEAYRATYGGGSRFTDLDGLVEKLMVDAVIGAATTVEKAKSGYVFKVVTSEADTVFCAGAAPATANAGRYNYSSNAPGVLYVHPLEVATPPTSTAGGVPFNR